MVETRKFTQTLATWYAAADGAYRMVRPLDYVVSLAITVFSFLTLYVNYWFPPGKIFDEIYFARAAEEYLRRQYIYENTHPPVTKLLITFSTMMFGGLPGGDTSYGWRFLDVVFGALVVWLLYVAAKRITGSVAFSAAAAILLACDGMHFVQSRIATPESFVAFFSLAAFYAFYRFWMSVDERVAARVDARAASIRAAGIVIGAVLAAGLVALRFPNEAGPAKIIAAVYTFSGLYLLYRTLIEPRFTGERVMSRSAALWLTLFALSSALLVGSKWYGIMAYGVATTVLIVSWARGAIASTRARSELRPAFRLDVVFATLVFAVGTVYALAYIPQFHGLSDTAAAAPRPYTLTDVVNMQYNAYEYHHNLRATHPYASKWWQWPLDLRPILYYADYGGSGASSTAAMIYSLPNPLVLWFGIFSIPIVAYLAWRERNKAYALIVLTYVMQWLPWIFSPRIAWAYHFYVNIPLICLANAIVLQRACQYFEGKRRETAEFFAQAYVGAVVVAFAYFYPILAGRAILSSAWQHHMWLKSWY
ncbi:MAG: phospholipid carrier-dependent glycosyltransferase [Candidatus Eremiobacteraeota bacterium]|nr:phospholipid carrier-dependent glycosyltransferase [Candidatus Eremiobacteraeota bacterium]